MENSKSSSPRQTNTPASGEDTDISPGAADQVTESGTSEFLPESWLAEKCVFCTQELKEHHEPKLLPCLHTTCKACLNAETANSPSPVAPSLGISAPHLVCPSCNQDINPNEAIDHLFLMEQLSHNTEGLLEESRNYPCTSCEEGADASGFCQDCQEWLCDACVTAHHRVRVTKDHIIRPKEEMDGEKPAALSQKYLFCPIHSHEPLKLYCESCDKLTCRDCQLSDHKEHKYQFLANACEDEKTVLTNLLGKIKEKQQHIESACTLVNKRHAEIMQREQTVTQEIKTFAVKFITEINRRGKQLLQELADVCTNKKTQLSYKHQELINMGTRLEYSKKFAEAALNHGSETALVYSKRSITNQLRRILKHRCEVPNPQHMVDISFSYEGQYLTQYISTMGTLMVDQQPVLKPSGAAQPPPQQRHHQQQQQPLARQPQQMVMQPQQQQQQPLQSMQHMTTSRQMHPQQMVPMNQRNVVSQIPVQQSPQQQMHHQQPQHHPRQVQQQQRHPQQQVAQQSQYGQPQVTSSTDPAQNRSNPNMRQMVNTNNQMQTYTRVQNQRAAPTVNQSYSNNSGFGRQVAPAAQQQQQAPQQAQPRQQPAQQTSAPPPSYQAALPAPLMQNSNITISTIPGPTPPKQRAVAAPQQNTTLQNVQRQAQAPVPQQSPQRNQPQVIVIDDNLNKTPNMSNTARLTHFPAAAAAALSANPSLQIQPIYNTNTNNGNVVTSNSEILRYLSTTEPLATALRPVSTTTTWVPDRTSLCSVTSSPVTSVRISLPTTMTPSLAGASSSLTLRPLAAKPAAPSVVNLGPAAGVPTASSSPIAGASPRFSVAASVASTLPNPRPSADVLAASSSFTLRPLAARPAAPSVPNPRPAAGVPTVSSSPRAGLFSRPSVAASVASTMPNPRPSADVLAASSSLASRPVAVASSSLSSRPSVAESATSVLSNARPSADVPLSILLLNSSLPTSLPSATSSPSVSLPRASSLTSGRLPSPKVAGVLSPVSSPRASGAVPEIPEETVKSPLPATTLSAITVSVPQTSIGKPLSNSMPGPTARAVPELSVSRISSTKSSVSSIGSSETQLPSEAHVSADQNQRAGPSISATEAAKESLDKFAGENIRIFISEGEKSNTQPEGQITATSVSSTLSVPAEKIPEVSASNKNLDGAKEVSNTPDARETLKSPVAEETQNAPAEGETQSTPADEENLIIPAAEETRNTQAEDDEPMEISTDDLQLTTPADEDSNDSFDYGSPLPSPSLFGLTGHTCGTAAPKTDVCEAEDTAFKSSVISADHSYVHQDESASKSDASQPVHPVAKEVLQSSAGGQVTDHDMNEDYCSVCGDGGHLLCCGNCPRVFHLHCLVPAKTCIPEGDWTCLMCKDITKMTIEDERSKRKGRGLSNRDRTFCERMLLEFYCQKESAPFHLPIDKKKTPNYYKIIKSPIDMGMIKMRLKPTHFESYQSVQEFVSDVSLMLHNCCIYNRPGTHLHDVAKRFEDFFKNLLKIYFPDLPYPSSTLSSYTQQSSRCLSDEKSVSTS